MAGRISFLRVNEGCKVYDSPRFIDTSVVNVISQLFQLLNNILCLPDAPQIYFLKLFLEDNDQLAVPQ